MKKNDDVITNERRVPLEITAVPFYSEENIKRIKESIKQFDKGKIVVKTIDELEAMEKNQHN